MTTEVPGLWSVLTTTTKATAPDRPHFSLKSILRTLLKDVRCSTSNLTPNTFDLGNTKCVIFNRPWFSRYN